MYLYIAIFPNDKKYIGITANINKRKVTHKSRAKNNYKGFFYNAVRKYGWDNIVWEVADGYKDINELGEVEIKKIAEYKTQDRNFGYNIVKGGNVNCGFKHTEEWKKQASKSRRGNLKYGHKVTKEEKEHLSKINLGKLHPRYGKKKSKEEIVLISRGLKKYYEENDSSFKGKHHTNEAKEKISKANSGKNNGMYGKIGENSSFAKLNYKKAEEIRKKYKTGKYTYSDLSKEYNISISQIGNVLKNRVWVKGDNCE